MQVAATIKEGYKAMREHPKEAMKTGKALKGKLCEELLRSQVLFSLEKTEGRAHY